MPFQITSTKVLKYLGTWSPCALVLLYSLYSRAGVSSSRRPRSHFLTGWQRFSLTLTLAAIQNYATTPMAVIDSASLPIERRHEVRYRPVSSPATLEVCSGASPLYGALSFY